VEGRLPDQPGRQITNATANQVSRAKENKKTSEPDVRTHQQIEAARQASRAAEFLPCFAHASYGPTLAYAPTHLKAVRWDAMSPSIDAMTTTLRVLTALNEKRDPDPTDIAELRRMAPELAGSPPDELACHVLQNALNERAETRRVEDSRLIE
jgi:hypothetical protein